MRLAVIAILLGLAGCTTQSYVDKKVSQIPPASSPTYKTGYADGCYTVVSETCSASGISSPRRDTNLFRTDKDYSQGWNDGVQICSCAGTKYMYVPLTSD